MPEQDEEPKKRPFEGFRVQIDPDRIDETLKQIRERIRETFQASRYTRVRLSYKGRQLGPDIPLAVFLATEGVTFWLISPLPALLVNLGAKAFLDVEFVHEADELVQEGLTLYMDGELAEAEKRYRKALDKRPEDPSALYNLGTLLRVTGKEEEAIKTLRRAAMGPEGHPDVLRATEALDRLQGKRKL